MVWDQTTAIYSLVFVVGALSGYIMLMYRLAKNPRLKVKRHLVPSIFFGGASAFCVVFAWHAGTNGVITETDVWRSLALAFAFGPIGSTGPELMQRLFNINGGKDES